MAPGYMGKPTDDHATSTVGEKLPLRQWSVLACRAMGDVCQGDGVSGYRDPRVFFSLEASPRHPGRLHPLTPASSAPPVEPLCHASPGLRTCTWVCASVRTVALLPQSLSPSAEGLWATRCTRTHDSADVWTAGSSLCCTAWPYDFMTRSLC